MQVLIIFMAWSTLVAGQQRQHLLRSLATFSVAKGSVFAEDDRATIEAAIQEWYGGGEAGAGEGGADGAGGAKRDGIALFERELHEGKVHAAVHSALGGVSGFSVSDLFVAALPMYLDLLDYAFVNPWVWRGGERGGASMVLTSFFVSAPAFTFLPIVLALLLVPASRGMARCGAVSSSGSTYCCMPHLPWLYLTKVWLTQLGGPGAAHAHRPRLGNGLGGGRLHAGRHRRVQPRGHPPVMDTYHTLGIDLVVTGDQEQMQDLRLCGKRAGTRGKVVTFVGECVGEGPLGV